MFDEITEELLVRVSRDWTPEYERRAKLDSALRALILEFSEKLRGRPFIQVDVSPQGVLGVGAGEGVGDTRSRDVSFSVSRNGITVAGGSIPPEEVTFHYDPVRSEEPFVYKYEFRAQLLRWDDKERDKWVGNMPARVPGMAVLADLLAERMQRPSE